MKTSSSLPETSSNKQRKRDKKPVRRPSTPTPTMRPKARPQSGTRSSPPSIQQKTKSICRLPDGKCEGNQSSSL
ncbi:hypothetical protein CGRA01v4_01349 [Colletotrichum graminicola]|nr:hypothetical protein CGRA01v4_01349 [Colletotrichum graminicola]